MIYCCSVCYGVDHPRTLVQGTVICVKCLKETLKKSEEIMLQDKINQAIKKEDIYD